MVCMFIVLILIEEEGKELWMDVEEFWLLFVDEIIIDGLVIVEELEVDIKVWFLVCGISLYRIVEVEFSREGVVFVCVVIIIGRFCGGLFIIFLVVEVIVNGWETVGFIFGLDWIGVGNVFLVGCWVLIKGIEILEICGGNFIFEFSWCRSNEDCCEG